jgi:hypothetical protein
LILPEKINLKNFTSIDLIEMINSRYIPRINAIVPPDTPGTTSATPIQKPFKPNTKYSHKVRGLEVSIVINDLLNH